MPHDSYPPTQQNSRKRRAKSTSPSADSRKDTVFREFGNVPLAVEIAEAGVAELQG